MHLPQNLYLPPWAPPGLFPVQGQGGQFSKREARKSAYRFTFKLFKNIFADCLRVFRTDFCNAFNFYFNI
jgi:hypothetical protein